ncbi:MAG: hypothetical protein LCH69_13395 [Proteobacteria bacterium]|nr:hypothetical protein [Pseudomonadota bacterium]
MERKSRGKPRPTGCLLQLACLPLEIAINQTKFQLHATRRKRDLARCIFCNVRRANSKEHTFGKWWKKHYPEDDIPANAGIRHYVADQGKVLGLRRTKGTIGSANKIHQQAYKVVCDQCNNGWMNQIEQDMQLIFPSVYIENREVSDPQMKKSVENWLFMKGCLQDKATKIIADYEEVANRVGRDFSLEVQSKRQEVWERFQLDRSLPDGLKTYLFLNSSARVLRVNFVTAPIVRPFPEPPIEFDDRRYFLMAFGEFGAIQTNHSDLVQVLEREDPNFITKVSSSCNIIRPAMASSALDLDAKLVKILNELEIPCFGPKY